MVEPLPMVLDAAGQYFVRPHPYRMAAGGSVERRNQTHGVESLNEIVTDAETSGVSWFVERCIPGLGRMPPKRAHAILYHMPGDGLPALGAVSTVRGLYIGAGFGTSAFAVAPAVGEILAQMVIDGQSGQDVSPFSPMRAGLRNL
jgi:sarcosine oxidase subunit beta